MTITRAWQPTTKPRDRQLLLEFGELTQFYQSPRGPEGRGESTLWILGAWRVEGDASVRFGSDSTENRRESGLEDLVGRSVESVETVGPLDDIRIQLDSHYRLCSFASSEQTGNWQLRLPDDSVLKPKDRWIRDEA